MFKLGTVICSTYDKRIAGPIVGYGVIGWDGDAGEPIYLIQVAPASSSLGPACRVVRHSHSVLADDVQCQHMTAVSSDFPGLSQAIQCRLPAHHEGVHMGVEWEWGEGLTARKSPKP